LAAAALVTSTFVLLVGSTPPSTAAQLSPKLRPDLAALVSSPSQLDPRIPPLVPGYVAGDIPYFVATSEPNDAAHAAQITALGARLLRTYASFKAFAVVSSPAVVQTVAALPWVTWLAPVEIVRALDEPALADQTKGTAKDVGASDLWSQGLTGNGVKIAVLDTGIDPTHPDLDDLDFQRWSQGGPAKVTAAHNFVGGICSPGDTEDRNGHGTHVSGIAAGTGEGASDDDPRGRHMGIAPDATLAVGKVFTDGGVGLNSDLIAAMEWASLPAGTVVEHCPGGITTAVGASIVNMSLGSEARPQRLNTGSDVDAVSVALNALAVANGTLFVASAGNSGPYIGSLLEAPGAAAQALSVSASAKDFDLNNDQTESGNTCAGWSRAGTSVPGDNTCAGEAANQPSSLSAFSSRGPSGDVWLRPDVAAPGYDIVSAEAASGAVVHSVDIAPNTVDDPLYATVSGTSMAAPATSGTAAVLLQAYRRTYGSDPAGGSGLSGLRAPAYVLLRAALMNTATSDLYEARLVATQFGVSADYYEARNIGADPYVGPDGEGSGQVNLPRAIAALRDGAVLYSAAASDTKGTGHRDFQGSWQVGTIPAGGQQTQRFVLHAAPGAGPLTTSFSFVPGHPSDSAGAIVPAKKSWSASLPGKTKVARGGEALVSFTLGVPAGAVPGSYTGEVLVSLSNGQTLHVPVFASVPLHDPNTGAGSSPPGAQARVTSAHDVYAKDDTVWPSAAGQALGATADWLVYPLQLGSGLAQAQLGVYDSDQGDETYDLYVYDSAYNLYASTHPFAAPGVTDVNQNNARGPSTPQSPPLTLTSPSAGTYYVVVSRARIGGMTSGDFGSFVLTLDEIR
jgi:subtilisin family serine protease